MTSRRLSFSTFVPTEGKETGFLDFIDEVTGKSYYKPHKIFFPVDGFRIRQVPLPSYLEKETTNADFYHLSPCFDLSVLLYPGMPHLVHRN